MYNLMVSISISVVGLLLTFQGTRAFPPNITNNHNSTEIVKISNNSLDIEKLRSLEDSLRILQQKVSVLSSRFSEKSLKDIYVESKYLQIDLNNIQTELNNTVTKEYQLVSDYLGSNSMVDIFYNLTEQKRYLDMQIEEVRETQFTEDCIQAVENRFILTILSLTSRCSNIEYIVKQLSVDEVFYLSDRIRNISKRFLFYKTIIKGVNKFHGTDNRLDYIIRLITSVKEEIIDRPKIPKALSSEAIEFHNDLSSQLQSLFYSKLDLYGTSHCNDSDLWLFDAMIIADYALASKIFYNLTSDSVRHSDLINCFLESIFLGTFRREDKALNYALFLKYFEENFRKTNENYIHFQKFVDQLTPLVNTIVFSEKVCIVRFLNGYYLRSSNHSHDNVKYTTYTQNIKTDLMPEAIWKLTHVENNIFFIENVGVADTYLDTDLSNEDIAGEHAVYGWHKPTNIGKWKFEFSSGLRFVIIGNLATDELLYTSSETDNYAFTKFSPFPAGSNQYEWDIVNCDS